MPYSFLSYVSGQSSNLTRLNRLMGCVRSEGPYQRAVQKFVAFIIGSLLVIVIFELGRRRTAYGTTGPAVSMVALLSVLPVTARTFD